MAWSHYFMMGNGAIVYLLILCYVKNALYDYDRMHYCMKYLTGLIAQKYSAYSYKL